MSLAITVEKECDDLFLQKRDNSENVLQMMLTKEKKEKHILASATSKSFTEVIESPIDADKYSSWLELLRKECSTWKVIV